MADEHERPFRGSRHTYSSLQKVKNILQIFIVYCGQLFIDLFVGLAFSIVIHVPSPSVGIVLVRLVKKCDILLIQDKPAALPGKIIRPPHLVLNPALDLVGSKRRGFFQVQSVQIGREKKLGNLLSQPMSRCYP
jgi:hypothetical protein